jgi:SWIM zinc finger
MLHEKRNETKQQQQPQQPPQQENKIYAKAVAIASTKRIHKSSMGDIWLVESGTVKNKFYKVQYDKTLNARNALSCECPYFTFNNGALICKHIISICLLREKGLRK